MLWARTFARAHASSQARVRHIASVSTHQRHAGPNGIELLLKAWSRRRQKRHRRTPPKQRHFTSPGAVMFL